jgi:hypothetical protein
MEGLKSSIRSVSRMRPSYKGHISLFAGLYIRGVRFYWLLQDKCFSVKTKGGE